MDSFEHKGVRLAYTVSGEGRPLLFLHGMGGSRKQIDSVCDPIPGVMLINMDQQGHGESGADWSDFGFDRLADDAAALLEHLGIERAVLAGISMGAAVALNMAERYPERAEGLFLIRNAWADRPMSGELIRAYADLGRCLRNGGEEAFRRTQGWELVKEPSAYTRNAFLSPFADKSCLRYPEKYAILPPQKCVPSPEDIRNIACPVSVLANRNDLCHPYALGEYIHALLPASEFTEIPDKDTDPALHRQRINEKLRDFLGKAGEAGK